MSEKAENRAKADFKQFKEHSDKINVKRYEELPSVIEKPGGDSLADRTMRDLMETKVFKSNPKTIKEENSNPRRYK